MFCYREFAECLVRGLIQVLEIVNLKSLHNFGAIVGEWVSTGLVNNQVIEYLWQMLSGDVEKITPFERRAVFQILSFAGNGRLSIVDKNIKLITEIGFKEYGKIDPYFVIIACQILSQVGNKVIQIEDETVPQRYPIENPMWEHLTEALIYHFETTNPCVSELSRTAVDAIYKVN